MKSKTGFKVDKIRLVCEWCGDNKIFPIHTVFSWITRGEFSGFSRSREFRSRFKNPQIWTGGDSFSCYFGCLGCDEVTELKVAGDIKTKEVDYFCGTMKLDKVNDDFIDFLKEESRKTKEGA